MNGEPGPYSPFSGVDAVCPQCSGRFRSERFPAGSELHNSAGWVRVLVSTWATMSCVECGHRRAKMCADAATPASDQASPLAEF